MTEAFQTGFEQTDRQEHWHSKSSGSHTIIRHSSVVS